MDRINSYDIIDRVGWGGESTVYTAWDRDNRRVVALKVFSAWSEAIADQNKTLLTLDQPNIIPLYQIGQHDGDYYLAMRYCPLGSLEDHMEAFPVEQVVQFVNQIVAALAFIHEKGILHRDLKPGNILMGVDGHLFLSDFGLAKAITSGTMQLHTGRGTEPYAPPEQQVGRAAMVQSEVYSFGVMVYEMLAGGLPWEGTKSLGGEQTQNDAVQLPPHANISPDMLAVLRKLTAADPHQRPDSIQRARRLLLTAVDASIPRTTPTAEIPAMAADAAAVMNSAQQAWREEQSFTLSETDFTLLASLAMDEQISRPHPDMMLYGALRYDRYINYWWQQAGDQRFAICDRLLREGRAVERAAEQILADPTTVGDLSPEAVEHLLARAEKTNAYQRRNLPLAVLGRAQADSWREVAFSDDLDRLLGQMALRDAVWAPEAARVTGKVRSQKAANVLIDAGNMEALEEVRRAAGSYPPALPLGLRWQIMRRKLVERVREDRTPVLRVLLGMAGGLLAVLMLLGGLLAPLSLQMRDAFFQPYPVSGIVTIVAVDDDTLDAYGRWAEWPRSRHVTLIETLDEMGARAIVFDFVFAGDTADDEALAEAMREAGTVVQPILGQGDAFTLATGPAQYEDGVRPEPELVAASVGLGHTNIFHDVDGVIRRIPAVTAIGGETYPSLALRGLQAYVGSQTPIEQQGSTVRVAGRSVPLGEDGTLSIHYAGPPSDRGEQTYRVVSYADVLAGEVDPSAIEGKLVLVGIMATAEPDRYLTPVGQGQLMFGVEILANAVETVWSGRYISQPALWVQVALLLALGGVIGLAYRGPAVGILTAAMLLVVYFIASSWLFDAQGIMLDLVYPLITLVVSTALVTAYRFSVEQRQRRELLGLLERRMSPTAARTALDTLSAEGSPQDDVRLATVLYTVINAPDLAAVDAVSQIARRCVTSYEGTIVQAEGKRIVSIFNAPLTQPDHTERAVQTAHLIQEKLHAYRTDLPAEHPHHALEAVCGIYTGKAVIGYDSSDQRYTAFGEAVEQAERLAAGEGIQTDISTAAPLGTDLLTNVNVHRSI